MFGQLPESSPDSSRRNKDGFLYSVGLHGVVFLLMTLLPMAFHQALPDQEVLTYLMAQTSHPPLPAPPPPPGPVPLPGQPVESVWLVRADPDIFAEPDQVPDGLEPPGQLPYLVDLVGVRGQPDNVTGGIPGPVRDALTGAEIGFGTDLRLELPPPPPPTPRKDPRRIGGDVQASKLIKKVEPVYPPLARKARVQGIVFLQVAVAETGTISEVKIIRGHPLLVTAAAEAVRQWRYSPTLLNGEPVPVIATVTVRFVLQ